MTIKSRYLYWLLPFGVFLALFLTQNTALGAGGFQQTNASLITNSLNNNYVSQTLGSPTGNFILGDNGAGKANLEIKVKAKYVNGSQTISPSVYLWRDATFKNFSQNCGTFNDSFDGIFQYLDTCRTEAPIIYLKDYYFQSTSTYMLQPALSNGSAQWYGGLASSYPNGAITACDYGCSPVKDIYFTIGTQITNSVSINNIASSTDAEISFQWPYQLDSAVKFQNYYTIFPNWDLYKCDPSCFTKIGSNLGYNSIPNNNIATGTTTGFTLDNGTFQIQNFYLEYDDVGNGSITASTTPVSSNQFFINFETSYIPIISFPTSTASSTEWVFTCDPESGFFSNSMCNLAQWLFIPSQGVLNQFSNLTADISQKPPIGYFTSIKNSLSSFTSSTPAFTIDIDSNDPVATTFFTPIRTGMVWILWLFFTFWVFHRFRHFNFTSP